MLRGNMPLVRYIREQVLGDDAAPRKKRGRHPVKDHEALGCVLGALGSSRLSSNLNQLARQANAGLVPVNAAEIRACLDIINALARTL